MSKIFRRLRCWLGWHKWAPIKTHCHGGEILWVDVLAECGHCGIEIAYQEHKWGQVSIPVLLMQERFKRWEKQS